MQGGRDGSTKRAFVESASLGQEVGKPPRGPTLGKGEIVCHDGDDERHAQGSKSCVGRHREHA